MHHHRSELLLRVFPLAIVFLAASALRAADPLVQPPANAVLHLANGGFTPGAVKDSSEAGIVRWESPSFSTPFDFRLCAVNAIQFPPPSVLPKSTGDYGFELSGGDIVFGALLDLNEKVAELDLPRLGRFHVQRSQIRRMIRWRDGADLIYLGPNGLAGWRETSSKPGWREESGQLVSDQAGASLQGDFGLPNRAAIEFEISWKTKPDFVLALGVNSDSKTVAAAFRLEAWDGDLVVKRETENEADLASVQEVSRGAGRAHLLAYLDQELGRIQVFSPGGKSLADLKVNTPKPQVLARIFLENKHGDIRLERLRISRWNGDPPSAISQEKSLIHRVDGSVVSGPITKFDAVAKQFVVNESAGETRVAADQISGLALPLVADDRPRTVRAVLQDGARLSGEMLKVDKGEIWLTVPGIAESPRLPLASLRSLIVLRPDSTSLAKGEGMGRLEIENVRLPGRLAESSDGGLGSRLAWQPIGSVNASPFRPGVAAKVIFREPTPPPVQTAQMRVQQVQQKRPRGFADGMIRVFSGSPPAQVPQKPIRRALHLRTGDIIPAELTKIDEAGVSFRTPLSEGTFVSHDRIKAIELAPDASPALRINKSKRERLLTLPRIQKDSPPTQLIRSTNGDYLRGRVVKMDDKTLQVEVRLETKDVPRDRVSRIIWLHADELEKPKDQAGSITQTGPTRVQVVRTDGFRLTFVADRLAEKFLLGKSDVLGTCRVKLDEVDQLLFNSAIDESAAQLEYQQWKLRNAEEPKFAKDDGDASTPGGASGTESALVGKPAPDFALDLLAGQKFHLADHKGQVVVLDFWATWCGPCLQAMPQVDRVTREFHDRGVQLVAVNLQESPKEITAMLARQKLNLTVALDRDGAVAEKYAATAIPQTVIIDRDGSVARLFIGGGSHFDDQLREALNAVVSGGTTVKNPN